MGDPGTTVETAAEARPDATFDPEEVIDRVTWFFSVPREQVLGLEGKSPRLADIKGFTTHILEYHTGLSRADLAEFMHRPSHLLSIPLSRGRQLLAESDEWRHHYRDLTAEHPPDLPLLDQYLAGFSRAYDVPPDLLVPRNPKEFLKEARFGLLYRLMTETPVPLERLEERFSLTDTGNQMDYARALFEREPGALDRIMAVDRSSEMPPSSESVEAIIADVLQETGTSLEEVADPSRRRRHVSDARHLLIRRLYYRTPLTTPEIGELTGCAPDVVTRIQGEGPPERDEAARPSPEHLLRNEAERLSGFFGMVVDRWERNSAPHQIMIRTLAEHGLKVTELARTAHVSKKYIPQILEAAEERLEHDPFFRRMAEALEAGVEPPGGAGLVPAVLELSARRAGTDVEGLLTRSRSEEGRLAQDWASYLLRRRVGLRAGQAKLRLGTLSADTIRRGLERLTEEVERSEETAAVERFMWRCLLRDHRPHETDDAVLYFPANGGRKAAIGKVAEVHEEDEGRLLVIKGRNRDPEYTVFDGDPTVIDAESAAVIIRDPRLLDVWLFSHEVGAFTRKQMREALDRRCASGMSEERQAK